MTLFLPEITLLGISVMLLFICLGKKERSPAFLNSLMVASGFILLGISFYSLNARGSLHASTVTYLLDPLSQGFKFLLALAFLFTLLMSSDSVSIPEERLVEYYFFLSTAMLGMMMIASAAELLTLYISLELAAYSLYLLTATRKGRRNAEGSVKYLIFGAAVSGFFLWGASLLTGLSGTSSLPAMAGQLPALAKQPAFLLGLVFVSFSFLFKLSSFPLHFWAPDAYECASTPVTHFIATASKGAAVAILIRAFLLMGLPNAAIAFLAAISFISMIWGNSVALVQQDVKRLLAYSSIAQAGYLLVGLLSNSAEGYASAYFYALAYILMNTGAFMVTIEVAKAIRHDNPQVAHFDGLAERSPLLALVLLVSLLSLAGIPPLAGFTGKWILFSAAMNQGHWFLVLWGVLNSVVSLFYYLTIVKHAYLEKPKVPAPIVLPVRVRILGLFLFGALILLGLFPNFFITFAQKAVAAL